MTNATRAQVTTRTAMSMMTGRNSFVLNYALCQYGKRILRAVATLIRDGHDVSAEADGFRIDGSYQDWKSI